MPRKRIRIPGLAQESELAIQALLEQQAARIDQVLAVPPQRPVMSTSFFANPGEFVIVEPTAGMVATFPEPQRPLRAKLVTLYVRAAGTLRLSCVNGTIDGLAVGTITSPGVYTVVCDGVTGWRVFGPIAAGDSLAFSGTTLNYVGTNSLVTFTGITGNQGTLDISALKCGGAVCIIAPVGDWQIEGFTSTPAKPDGFWFVFAVASTNFVGTIFNDDVTAAAADRIRTTNEADVRASAIQAFVGKVPSNGAIGGSPRWRFVGDANNSGVVQRTTGGGTLDNFVLNANTRTLEIDAGNTAWALGGLTGGWPGRKLTVRNSSNLASTGSILSQSAGSAAANQIITPDNVTRGGYNRYSAELEYDGVDSFWRIVADTGAVSGTPIAIHSATAADAGYSVTVPSGATWFKAFAKGGGSGGGGADSETALEVTAGGGGGEGCEMELWFPVSTGAITGAIGAGGAAGSNAGGNGGAGGATTVIYNGSTYTANQGGVGIGTALGIVGAGGSATAGGSGGSGALTAGPNIALYSVFTTGETGSPGIMIGAAAVAAEAAIGGKGGGQGAGSGGIFVAAAGSQNGGNAGSQGCGGGGGARIVSASAVATGATGGTGSPGYVRFEFYSGPVPTFAAVV